MAGGWIVVAKAMVNQGSEKISRKDAKSFR